jgi:HipA-like protein
MRSARILYKNQPAGVLIQRDDGSFEFRYYPNWVDDPSKPPISLNLPKTKEAFLSPDLFPFFYSMLPEGSNRQSVCFHQRIDVKDDFGILLSIARHDSIGAVRLQTMVDE